MLMEWINDNFLIVGLADGIIICLNVGIKDAIISKVETVFDSISSLQIDPSQTQLFVCGIGQKSRKISVYDISKSLGSLELLCITTDLMSRTKKIFEGEFTLKYLTLKGKSFPITAIKKNVSKQSK